MKTSIVPESLHQKIVAWIAIAGLFFGLMPPYVLTIVVVATWAVPELEKPGEQTFRMVYYARLILGNVLGLTVGAFLAGAAAHFGLRAAGKATYARGGIVGAILGAVVGAITASACPLVLLISSTNVEWATTMIQRSFIVGGLMGLTNGCFAGLTIIYFLNRQRGKIAAA